MPTFSAAAPSKRQIALVFPTPVAVTPDLLDSSNYTVTDFLGNGIPVTSVSFSEPSSPISRLFLTLGSDLSPSVYYVVGTVGLGFSPEKALVQWKGSTSAEITVPVSQFSGEVTGGLLGEPEGLLFFSPALDDAVANSTIEVEEVSVCTQAYDVYEVPQIPDPQPLFTFGGPVSAVLGDSVLWAPAERLGHARTNLADRKTDSFGDPGELAAAAILQEPIDTTRGGFLNDSRWGLHGGAGVDFLVFDNLTLAGPGPSVFIDLLNADSLEIFDDSFDDSFG